MSKAWASDQIAFFLAVSEAEEESSEANCKIFRAESLQEAALREISASVERDAR